MIKAQVWKVTHTYPVHSAAVYRLSETINGERYIWVSARRSEHMHETFVFACNPDGTVTNWSEMGGVIGEMSHAKALASMDIELF